MTSNQRGDHLDQQSIGGAVGMERVPRRLPMRLLLAGVVDQPGPADQRHIARPFGVDPVESDASMTRTTGWPVSSMVANDAKGADAMMAERRGASPPGRPGPKGARRPRPGWEPQGVGRLARPAARGPEHAPRVGPGGLASPGDHHTSPRSRMATTSLAVPPAPAVPVRAEHGGIVDPIRRSAPDPRGSAR
jgi:hypothetical protein